MEEAKFRTQIMKHSKGEEDLLATARFSNFMYNNKLIRPQ